MDRTANSFNHSLYHFLFHLYFIKTEGSSLSIRRLLLLGLKGSGKTSTLNTILSQEKNPLDDSQTDQQHWVDILTWRLLIVDTPGWKLEAEDTTDETDSAENQQSIIDRCSPGPHALLLVVPIGVPFTEHHWQGLWARVRALGAGIWRHTMVLFTCADQLPQDMGVEEFIVDGGAVLQRLVERCGCRYHALDNTSSDKSVQVAELLQKVEEMVQENQGWYFEMVCPRLGFEDEETDNEREEDRGTEVERTAAMFRSPPRGEFLSISFSFFLLFGGSIAECPLKLSTHCKILTTL